MTPSHTGSGRTAGLIAMLVLAGSVLNHLAVLSPRLWIEWLALLVLAAEIGRASCRERV